MTRRQSAYSKSQSTKDRCYTPPYAVELIIPYLHTGAVVWEPACGAGFMAWALMDAGFEVVATDIESGVDFLTVEITGYDVIVTNPPYQTELKAGFIERCVKFCRPFALLMQVDSLCPINYAQWFKDIDIQLVIPYGGGRIDYFMPNNGYSRGGANFDSAWFTWGLNLPKQINYIEYQKPDEAAVLYSVERLRLKYGQLELSPLAIEVGGELYTQGLLV